MPKRQCKARYSASSDNTLWHRGCLHRCHESPNPRSTHQSRAQDARNGADRTRSGRFRGQLRLADQSRGGQLAAPAAPTQTGVASSAPAKAGDRCAQQRAGGGRYAKRLLPPRRLVWAKRCQHARHPQAHPHAAKTAAAVAGRRWAGGLAQLGRAGRPAQLARGRAAQGQARRTGPTQRRRLCRILTFRQRPKLGAGPLGRASGRRVAGGG